MKRTLALATVAVTTLGLTACSGAADGPAGKALKCELPQAKISQPVEVSGADTEPLTVKTDLSEVRLESFQLISADKGSGKTVVANPDVVYSMHITVTDEQGEVLVGGPLESSLEPESGLADWVLQAVGCASDSGRVIAAGPAKQLLPGAAEQSEGKFTPDTTLLAIIDLQGAVEKLSAEKILPHAEGKEIAADPGLPTVTFDPENGPQITIPKDSKPPKHLQIADLIEGTGETVAAGANVYVHYRGVIWQTGEEFDASWTRGSYTNFKTDGVVAGFSEAIVGKKVGSRVLSIVDPASGYGAAGLEQRGFKKDDVMVFVIDILGTENPQ